MEPLLGSIILFAGNFAPRGWALCNGQLLPIAQNTALYAILGTADKLDDELKEKFGGKRLADFA